MLLALVCPSGEIFSGLCTQIAAKDPTGVFGPVTTYLLGPICFFIGSLVAGHVIRAVAERTPVIRRDAQVHTLLHNVISAAMYIIAVFGALVVGGLPITVLLTFGGLGSLALGLAFQDVLRNILAGIFLLVEQPFKIGDVITVGEYTGVVETIQLRTTALKTGDGRLAVVPNLNCFSSPVVNMSAYDLRRFTVTVRVPRDRPLDELLRSARKTLTAHKSLAKHPAPGVRPQVDGEETLIHCDYWLDYRSFDADAVAAELAEAVAPLGFKTAS